MCECRGAPPQTPLSKQRGDHPSFIPTVSTTTPTRIVTRTTTTDVTWTVFRRIPRRGKHCDDDDDANVDTLEPWVDWIKRATHKAEAATAKLRINDWVSTVRQRKWQWVRRLSATGEQEWMRQIIQWSPQHDPVYNARRRTGRPKSRWIEDKRKYIQDSMGCDDTSTTAILNVASTDSWNDIGLTFTSHHMCARCANISYFPAPRRRTRSTLDGA